MWKFSRFTRNRRDAVVYKEVLRERGVKVTSIKEQADDTPAGGLTEGIIEVLDEFFSRNLAEDVIRGMRESAGRGFWLTKWAPIGYRREYVDDSGKRRPRPGSRPAEGRHGQAHVRHGGLRYEPARYRAGAERRGDHHGEGQEVGYVLCPQDPHERGVYRRGRVGP